jgi:hypothetical protein
MPSPPVQFTRELQFYLAEFSGGKSFASSTGERSIFPAVQEMLMRRSSWSCPRQGQLFAPPAKLPQLPAEVQQRMVRLLARMLNEHLNRQLRLQAEVGDE